MPIPAPAPGLVIRYDYLWFDEAAAGRDSGKERPACLVAASAPLITPRLVVILPITHAPPAGSSIGVSIPLKVSRAIGLDDLPKWVIVSEHNVDVWPNPGLAALPGRAGVFSYGFIPPGLFAQVKSTFLDLARHSRTPSVRR